MEKTLKYLKEYIDENAGYEDWTDQAHKKLSLQLSGAFDFYLVALLDEQALFLKPTDSYTPTHMEKWLGRIEEKTGMSAALILEDITPYVTRKFLMEHIGFVVPGKQISLPFLAMQIKSEKVRGRKRIKKLSPATQQVFLYILYADHDTFCLEDITREMNISAMTATRAMRELTEIGVIHYEIAGQTGRKKVFTRIAQKEYFSLGKAYLDSPVRDTVYVKELPAELDLLKADLTALAEQTMLGEPEQKCYCMPSRQKTALDKYLVPTERAMDEGLPIVQLMKYDISCLVKNGYEDPISLILGLSEHDERIDMAIDELMESMEWYEE